MKVNTNLLYDVIVNFIHFKKRKIQRDLNSLQLNGKEELRKIIQGTLTNISRY